ncbi:permease prefix domain 1-containing protein [Specibacter sp. RAF43]|uniref:permease prefix domain 1-containing protein n=1 Tax=Specibacter sp. RAF43 TaxID=3233057 RepID=UPI003F9D7DA6
MTTALTERYIAATVKSLPPTAQDDVRAELEASIADAVEARIEQGEQREEAERIVLIELGDPAVLAAGYADRPLHLIGPRYYLTWWRLLKLLLIIVPVCVVGAVALGQALADAPIGEIIGQSIAAGLSVVFHLCFWVTLVFVILDRTGADTGTHWNLDLLAEPQRTGTGRTDLIVSLAFLGLTAGAILWDQFRGFVRSDGEALPMLNPDLWPWAIAGLLALLGLEIVFAVVLYLRERWSTALAVVNTALAVLFASWTLTLLGRGQLVNPAFLDVAFLQNGVEQDVLRILVVLLVFGVVGMSAWDIVDGWLKKRRDAR